MRQLTLAIAALVCLAGEPAVQSTQAADPIAALLGRIEAAVLDGTPDRYLDLLSTLADRPAAASFLKAVATPGLTRVVIRERDRVDLAGTLPGDGYRLLVEVLRESGQRADVATWRLDVRRRGNNLSDWGILSQEVLTTLQGLYRLSLNPRRQFVARDLVVSAEDLKLSVPEASVFMAETESGPTAYVILGRGEMTFSPTPRGERSQLRVVTGGEVLQTPFEGLFVRIHPSTASARVSAREMIERPVDPRDLKRAEEIFRQDSVKSFGLDLGDLSADSWSLLPLPDDLLAEIRTRRFDTLTYTKSSDEVEDISLFDRRLRRNMSVYASRNHQERFSRSYYEDEGAEYVVRSYDVNVTYNPNRRQLEGQARLAIETTAPSINTLKIRLADSLAVKSIVSPELGRLLSVRVLKQHTVVVNLPATVIKGYRLELVVTYSGTLESQEIDRDAVSVSTPQVQYQPPEEEEEIPLDDSHLFSNRSYWYPQALTLGYAPARISVIVPEPWSAIASGEFELAAPPPGPAPPGRRLRQFSFVARQPVRYLTLLVGQFVEPRIEAISMRHLNEALLASRSPGVYYDEVELRVQTNRRQRARSRDVLRTTASILRFYASLVGDFPYSALTVAVIERRLPGGHSPPYLSIIATTLPGSTLRWSSDPAALPGFPDFFAAHELAHQWWGQAVGWKNYHENWLSEGFSQYFAALWAERSLGPGVFNGIIRSMQQWSMAESDQGAVYLGYRVGHFKGDGRLFRAVIYNKGAMVLHMLRRLVGDEAFFAGLRRYYYTWRFAKAGTDDFRRAVEAESGVDLGRFFEQWIYGEGLPQVAFTWRLEPRDGHSEAVLRFEQTGEVFDFAVTVTFEYADNTTTSTVVKVTDRVVETRVPVKGRPRRVDANRDLATVGVFR